MDFLNNYLSRETSGRICISAQQGSNFAKQIADDYNPIHHPDSRRFCIPGDLLFAIAIDRYGVRENMKFSFLEMLSADTVIEYPDASAQEDLSVAVKTAGGKPVLGIESTGATSSDPQHKTSLVTNYVAFSGHNFPDILVPLMREQNVMFNPQRPLVIYQSMQLSLDNFEFSSVDVELAETTLEVTGKRGEATLNFRLMANAKQVGKGYKTLILSGLRDYDETAIQSMRDEYAASKNAYKA